MHTNTQAHTNKNITIKLINKNELIDIREMLLIFLCTVFISKYDTIGTSIQCLINDHM